MTRRYALSTVALLSFALLAGCAPPWRVIRQSGVPSPLRGQASIGVSFEWARASLGGRSEQDWLATQPPEDQASYMEVRNALMSTFVSELAQELPGVMVQPSTGQETVQLSVQPLLLEMGFYRVVIAQDSRLDSALVWSVGGQATDEVTLQTRITANLYNPSILGRMNDAATRTARIAAQFWRHAQQAQ